MMARLPLLEFRPPTQLYRTSYFGTAKFDEFPPPVRELIVRSPQFIDITAGGGGVIYERVLAGQPASGNDRCYYAALSLRQVLCDGAAFDPGMNDERWAVQLSTLWHPENLPPATVDRVRKAAAKRASGEDVKNPSLSSEVAEYLDALLSLKDDLVRAVLAGWMSKRLTWRSLGWCRTDVESRPTIEYTPEEVGSWLVQLARRRRHFALAARNSAFREVTQLDALDAMNTLEILPGAVVWCNPAWPWEDTKQRNPYEFHTYDLSRLISDEPIPDQPFWLPSMDGIGADLLSWMEAAFRRGAGAFVLSNQSTNRPSPPEMLMWFAAKEVRPAFVLKTTAKGSSDSSFEDYFAVFGPEAEGNIRRALKQTVRSGPPWPACRSCGKTTDRLIGSEQLCGPCAEKKR